ncbi:MAG: alpha/beta fold hydrolase [Acidimicrobiales bacterium]|nr:alpha/beta fold hydrolase [Acidimicrobiales bacterium]
MSGPAVAFEEGFVAADGFQVRYLEAGEGPPMVCLHGAGGPRISPGYELLARHHRVIAFEVPGFGASAVNDRSASIEELAGTMCEAVAGLGLSQVTLLGSSFGGRLALWMAVREPERLVSLVLVAPAAILPERRDRQAGPPSDPAVLYAHPERIPDWWPPADPAVTAKQRDLVRRLSGPPRSPELEARMAELEVPTLVMFGTSDRVIPPTMGRHYRALLPRCQLMMVYDAGHVVDVDRPEAFAALVEDFVPEPEAFLVTRESGLLFP